MDPQGFGPDNTGHEGYARAAEQQRVPGFHDGGSHRRASQQKSDNDLERGKHDSLLR
jgi:hypothetical protein